MTDVRAALLGETGVERAAIWSTVGFALSYVAFDAAAVLGAPPAEWVAVAAAILAALGAVGLASVGGGALPCVLLTFGPFAAVLLRTLDPVLLPGTVLAPAADVEPVLVALAAAVAVGLAGYLVGRLVASLGGSDESSTENDAERSSEGDSVDGGSVDGQTTDTE